MKIIRHTARDMRQALRAVREQLGADACDVLHYLPAQCHSYVSH